MVHAWHHSTGTVTIAYTLKLEDSAKIQHINLYFYSITSMGIGLPSVTVYRGSTAQLQVVEYHIFGNDDITQEDNMRRQILLSLRSTSSSRSYTLQFEFENTGVDWLVLSETRLCTVPLQGIYAQNANSHLLVHIHVTQSSSSKIVRWLRVIFQDYRDRADKSTKFCTKILSDLPIKIRRGAATRNIRSKNYPPKLCTIYIKISIIAFTGQMSGPNFLQRYFEIC